MTASSATTPLLDPAGFGPPYETFDFTETDGIATLTLNRPDRLNALSARMALELQNLFRALAVCPRTRVVLLRGAGRAFCAGLDLKEIEAAPPEPDTILKVQRRVSEIILLMRRCPQPIIALVHGAAAGGGFALTLASDVRIGTPEARFNVAMARIGLSGCDVGISYFLPRAVGSSMAARLIYTGAFLDAERAFGLGLLSELVPRDLLDETGLAIAREMLQQSPLALRLSKDGLNQAIDAPSLEAVIAMEDRQQSLCVLTGDFNRMTQARRPGAPG